MAGQDCRLYINLEWSSAYLSLILSVTVYEDDLIIDSRDITTIKSDVRIFTYFYSPIIEFGIRSGQPEVISWEVSSWRI